MTFKNTDPNKHTQSWRKKQESVKRKQGIKTIRNKLLQTWPKPILEIADNEDLVKLQEV